jgi:hypothetical protein
MEKSIETIWKEGFLKSDALVAPKLNDLYNQKSKNIIEKIKRMMNINLVVIVVFSFAVLIWWYLTGVPYIGAFVFFLLNVFAIYGKIKMKRMKEIDKNTSSYEYLKSFDNWLKTMLSNNASIMRFFYPLCFLAAAATVWFSYNNEAMLKEAITKHFPDLYTVGGIPVVWLSGVLLVAIVMGFFSEKIYKWDVNLVYGRVFKKLEELIADMEELRS